MFDQRTSEIGYLEARGWQVVTRVLDMGNHGAVGWRQVLSRLGMKATGDFRPGMLRFRLLQNVLCSCSIEGPEQATYGMIDEWIQKIGSAYTVNK
jgi:hypothetical protein